MLDIFDFSLVRPMNLDQLVNYVLQMPVEEENEKAKYKLVLNLLCIVYYMKNHITLL